ncbi:MAG: ABC transporter ATP-binding protein [Abditibacteriota bacterium]|nr:ABC transporter ATP-binding protein [Abditibacteriota bacterium]
MNEAIVIDRVSKSFVLQGTAPTIKKLILTLGRYKKQYKEALRDVSITIGKGEAVSIVGTNGSGKSTLLRIICGVYKPTSGQVRTEGRLYTMLDLGSGFHPDLTGMENIYFNGAVLGMSKAEIEARIDSIISFCDLGSYIDQPIRTYSAGMLMRLGFAIATETDPDILLIDEVLAVGDAAFQEKCYARMARIREEGRKTIVFVTHDMHAATGFADRTVWIKEGRVYMDGPSGEVVKQYLRELDASADNLPEFRIRETHL